MNPVTSMIFVYLTLNNYFDIQRYPNFACNFYYSDYASQKTAPDYHCSTILDSYQIFKVIGLEIVVIKFPAASIDLFGASIASSCRSCLKASN
jgi:hypothetical protein